MEAHVVFGDSAAGSLKIALKNVAPSGDWELISFSDRFSVGPVWHLHEASGLQNRIEWIEQRMNEAEREQGDAEYYKNALLHSVQRIKAIPKEATVTVWNFEDAHEQTGTRFVLKLLGERDSPVQLMNVPRTFRKGRTVQRYLHLGEFSASKLGELLGTIAAEPIKSDQRKQLLTEWEMLSQSNSVLRIWQNGEIISLTEDYFDEAFIRFARKNHRGSSIKAARLIGEVMAHINHYVSDQFLEYRLRCLVERGVFQAEGSLAAMRFYSVQLKP